MLESEPVREREKKNVYVCVRTESIKSKTLTQIQ